MTSAITPGSVVKGASMLVAYNTGAVQIGEYMVDECIPAYNEYRFGDIVTTLSTMMTNELSAYYLDYTKDILYIEKTDDRARREVQTVLYTAVEVLAKLWAPILCHTTEEINSFMKFN